MSRRLFIGLVCLALSWASSVNSVEAQSAGEPAKPGPFERLVKQVADWIPIQRWTPEADLTLPPTFYLKHPPKYFPPSEPYPLPKELKLLEDAEKLSNEASVLQPTPKECTIEERMKSAIELMKQNKLKEAEAEFRKLREMDPDNQAIVAALHLIVNKREQSDFVATEKRRAIENRLKQPISFNFKRVPLKQVARGLSAASGVSVVLDVRALEESRVKLDAPISICMDNVAMRSALNLMMDELRLRWVIQDEVILITTQDRGSSVRRKTYDIADLLQCAALVDGKKADDAADAIKELIQNTVIKNSWETFGGQGVIQYFPLEKKLIVAQSQEAHEEIEMLLAALRRLYDPSIEVKTWIVSASASTAKQWRKEMARSAGAKQPNFALLNDTQVFLFLEAVQGDRAATILQMPKLTVLNGQTGSIDVPGSRCTIQSVASPDRKSVRLNVTIEHRVNDKTHAVERITKAIRSANVPDDRTAMWHLGEGAERRHLFVLVSPRIQMRQEPEKIFLGEQEPIPGR